MHRCAVREAAELAGGWPREVTRAFLFSTARNLAANEYRHRRTVERGAVGDLEESRVNHQCESLESAMLRDDRHRLIQEAIDRLPSQCRAAFTLRVFHACS